jgi:hypothetical protein
MQGGKESKYRFYLQFIISIIKGGLTMSNKSTNLLLLAAITLSSVSLAFSQDTITKNIVQQIEQSEKGRMVRAAHEEKLKSEFMSGTIIDTIYKSIQNNDN